MKEMTIDYLIFLFSAWLALSLVNEEIIRFSIIQFILVTLMTFCGIFSFYLIGMYKSLIKFSFYQSFLSIFLSVMALKEVVLKLGSIQD